MKSFKNITLLFITLWINNIANSQTCLNFQDTSLNKSIATTQLTYTPVWYSSNGITFRSKYKDFTTMGLVGGATIGNYITGGYTTSNTNFSGNIFYQGNLITEINFSGISYANKTIDFDVNGIVDSSSANPYRINGMSKTSLPAGVTYTVTNLTNGLHVTITGNVNTIEFHGFEVAMDNLCVNSATLSIEKKEKDVFEIYPNPAKNFINLKLNQNNFSQLRIIDLTGKSVYHSTTFDKKINVNNFKKGVYVIQVIYLDRVITKKFIKQ